MQINIVTIHFGDNYGSALQSYALFSIIKDMGHDVKIFDYVPERYNYFKNLMKAKKGRVPYLGILAYFILTYPRRFLINNKFVRFLKKNANMTKRYNNTEQIKQDCHTADAYISGSDQVWNYSYNTSGDYTYFLDFVSDNSKKISYAASFGKNEISAEETKIFSKLLKNFDSISVRENTGLDILRDCGIENAKVLIDPTMLISQSKWLSLSTMNFDDTGYLLIYVMSNRYEKLINIAEKIAKQKNLKIYTINIRKIRDSRIDKQFNSLSPENFSTLFNNASYIVTNSFHGCVFSIIFGKQFLAVGNDRFDTRMECLLETFCIKDRFIKAQDEDVVCPDIDYDKINAILKREQKKALDFLSENLN